MNAEDYNHLGGINYIRGSFFENKSPTEEDEICKSLREFGAMAVREDRNDEQLYVESIKRDFVCNGYHVDGNLDPYDVGSIYERNTLRRIQHAGSLKEIRKTPKKITKTASCQFCVFCENNNEPEPVVRSHAVRDAFGRVLCPKLRTYTCPICGVSGDKAHTIKYCPKKPIVTMEDTLVAQTLRLAKMTYYKNDMKI